MSNRQTSPFELSTWKGVLFIFFQKIGTKYWVKTNSRKRLKTVQTLATNTYIEETNLK